MEIIVNARFLTQKLTGVQRFAFELAKRLKAVMPDIVFVSPSNIIHHELAAQLDIVVIGRNKGVVWEQVDLPRYLKKNNRPLLINLGNVAPLFYDNQVVTIHDVSFLVDPTWFSKNFVRFYKFLIPRILKKSKLVFTVSEFSKAEIIRYFDIEAAKINVVYNSVSDLPVPEPVRAMQSDYILVVGSIDKRKNIFNLVSAFQSITNRDLKLVIAGDNNPIFSNEGNEELSKHKDIIFTGRVTDQELANLYAGAKLFVYPSLYEGFGIPPLEAMSYGCPTLVSDIGSLREVCGDASLYVNPLDTADIAGGIERLLDDTALANNLISLGKQNIKRFDLGRSANQILDAIKPLITNP
jgi:glycosyltransferase involved in cell wall biosynthesis